jgi:Fe-S cluster assembly scaffold protein SufB
LRRQVLDRCGGICERCDSNRADCVHHLTYARKYSERLEDLAGWCNACHEFTHGKCDFDPAVVAQEKRWFDAFFTLAERLKKQGITFSEMCGALSELHQAKKGNPYEAWAAVEDSVGGLASDFALTKSRVSWRLGGLEVVVPSQATAAFLNRPEIMARIRGCLGEGVGVVIKHE